MMLVALLLLELLNRFPDAEDELVENFFELEEDDDIVIPLGVVFASLAGFKLWVETEAPLRLFFLTMSSEQNENWFDEVDDAPSLRENVNPFPFRTWTYLSTGSV